MTKSVLMAAGLMLASLTPTRAMTNLWDIPLNNIDGKATSLRAFEGKVVLVVNVASQCGLTPQYEQLESVYLKYKDQGLVVAGFPCNDFAGQEPGSNAEIKQFCSSKFQVSFPLFDKLHVKGAGQHPLYQALTGKQAPFPGDVKWNFGKFLVSRQGTILKRFEPAIKPDAPEVIQAIESALKAKAE